MHKEEVRCIVKVFLTLGLTMVTSMSALHSFSMDQEPSKNEAKKDSDVNDLVEALANRNPPPKIVRTGGLNFLDAYVPLFDKSYDWKEQARVVKATEVVNTHPSPALWECLIAHENDRRYWMTLADEEGAEDFGSAHNWLVGDFCGELAYAQLTFPVERHVAILEGTRPVDDWGKRKPPVQLSLPSAINLLQLRESYPARTFAEWQIDVCEEAIASLPKLVDIPEQTKDEFRAQVEAEIEQLKKRGDGIFKKIYVFSGERYNRYDAARAANIRERYEKSAGPKESSR